MKEKDLKNCEVTLIHEDIVNKVRESMPAEESVFNLANLYKSLSDPTRLKILNALYFEEMCVCDIAGLLNMTQSAISHQLRVLKNTDLVKSRRDGKVIYYSLADNHVIEILEQGMTHITE